MGKGTVAPPSHLVQDVVVGGVVMVPKGSLGAFSLTSSSTRTPSLILVYRRLSDDTVGMWVQAPQGLPYTRQQGSVRAEAARQG